MTLRAAHALPAIAALAAACASSGPTPSRPGPSTTRPVTPGPVTPGPVTPPPIEFALSPVSFADIPGWATTDHAPALAAFQRQCASWRQRSPEASVSGGRYGGVVREWLPACDAAVTIQPGQERWFFETYFSPASVSGPGEAKLTAYFEPIVPASRTLAPGFTEPFLSRPADMVTVDLGAFAEAHDNETLRGAPRSLTGRVNGARVEPYPKRESIAPAPDQVIAWAHPADVYSIQVQGSGRLRFPDGTEARAAFAAQNGYRWNSALGALRTAGHLASVTWDSFRAWLDSNPQAAKSTLDADPSYVFFQEEPVLDYSAGPRGAANVPLTPAGSMAIDPAFHPYGAVIFVDGTHGQNNTFRRLMVAQDTGGAIQGPVRGDVFWGAGEPALALAGGMQQPGRYWLLLPATVAERLTPQ
jgi:membrane-bound lytic murein transglycosylase A